MNARMKAIADPTATAEPIGAYADTRSISWRWLDCPMPIRTVSGAFTARARTPRPA